MGRSGTDGPDALDVAERRRLAGGDAGDDECVGEAAVGGVTRHVVQFDRGERNRVLAAHVDEEPGRRPEQPPVAQRPVRVALEHALVRHDGADVDVDPHERGPDCRGDGQRRPRVVLEHVEADRQPHGPSHLTRGNRHGRDGRRVGPVRTERRVPEVLHEAGVEAAHFQGARVGHRVLDDRVEGAAPARASGQREEMDHPDQRAPQARERLVAQRRRLGRVDRGRLHHRGAPCRDRTAPPVRPRGRAPVATPEPRGR